jgi:hypothetical protein
MGDEGKSIAAQVTTTGDVTFAEAPTGRLWLQGRVVWDRDNDEQLKDVASVQVYVNDILQLPTELRATASAGERSRSFRAPLFLNNTKGNRVEIVLPELKQEASNRRQFALDCASAEQGQRLHLLVVGVGVKDDQKLMGRLLQALGAPAAGGDQFATPAFQAGQVYGPLTDYVNRRQVYYQLCKIRENIRRQKNNDLRTGKGSLTDVVMMYYQGGETVHSDAYVLLTSESLDDSKLERSAIGFADLASRLGETPGAPMLLLDTVRAESAAKANEYAQQKADRVMDDLRVNVIRSTWRAVAKTTTPPPAGAQLLTAFEDALKGNSRVGEVVSVLDRHFRAQQYSATVTFTQNLQPGLLDVRVGPRVP